MSEPMVAVATRQGPRPYQEDRAVHGEVLGSGLLAAVFDGHGGDAVAAMCAESFLEYWESDDARDPAKFMRETFAGLDFLAEDWPSVGACAAAIHLSKDNVLTVANSGDCEVVVVPDTDGSEPRVVSTLHRISNADERLRVVTAGGIVQAGSPYVWDVQQWRGLMPTRSIGDYAMRGSGIIAEPAVTTLKLQPPCWVVLGTDGIWDGVNNASLLWGILTDDDGKTYAERLVERAFWGGSQDNATAVVAHVVR